MENSSNFFARQPILNRQEEIYAYEFFYRDMEGGNQIIDPRSATASILVSLVNQFGLQSSAADAKLFINTDPAILQSDILLSLPPERFVFELPITTKVTTKERELLASYFSKGYRFAIDNATASEHFWQHIEPIIDYITYVKFDTTATDMDLLPALLERLCEKKLIAERVEIPEVFEAYRDLGFDYFQGYFFAKLHLIRHNRIDPKHLGVIRIYSMLITATPMQQIAAEFKRHNELSLQLLQYVNSTGIDNRQPNRSLEELLQKVGADRIEQWLMMIIYSKSAKQINTQKSPFSLLIEQRVDIMNAIINAMQMTEESRLHEEARLCVFISMMETILNVPMPSLLQQIQVSESVEEALLSRSGVLGRVFALTLAIEKDEYASVQVLLKTLHLHQDVLETFKQFKKI